MVGRWYIRHRPENIHTAFFIPYILFWKKFATCILSVTRQEAKDVCQGFKLLSYHLDVSLKSINFDFEKAIHSAIAKVWSCCTYGCFFHLCQSWLKRLKKLKLYLTYLKSEAFASCFKQCQALAFIPESEVQAGLDEIKATAPASFTPMIAYIQKTYIKPSKPARFPVHTWSVYQRIPDDLPATNNPVESWHSSLTVSIYLYINK